MALDLRGRTLVVASHNSGKVREIRDLLGGFGPILLSAGDLALGEPEETEPDFIGNALLKARAAAKASGHLAIADDSGLEVHALGGAPGVVSARWAGPMRDFSLAMQRVENALKVALESGPGKDRRARFVCALALCGPMGEEIAVEGEVRGALVWPPRGDRGFGYDPIFVPDGGALTFGEMEPAAKHAISHRADAFAKLLKALQ